MAKEFRDFEVLVAKIQKQLAPDAEIIHDAKLPGHLSGTMRQVDVLVRQRIGQYEMLIVVECKDYKRPIDIKGIEEFHGLAKDVGAHKAAMVCPSGFTEAAKTRANGYQIDLYSPIDTDPHKWQVMVQAPVACDFRSAGIGFGIAHSAPMPFLIPFDFFTHVRAFDEGGKDLGTSAEAAFRKWNEGRFPIEPGEYENLPIFDTPEVFVDNGYGRRTKATLTVSLHVRQELYFGYVPVPRMSGFRDELAGGIITNAFELQLLDPNEITETWQVMKSRDEFPSPVVCTLRGLVAWGE